MRRASPFLARVSLAGALLVSGQHAWAQVTPRDTPKRPAPGYFEQTVPLVEAGNAPSDVYPPSATSPVQPRGAADSGMLDLAANIVSFGVLRMTAPANKTKSLVAGAIDARLYHSSRHGGLLRLGSAGELSLFSEGVFTSLYYVDAGYTYWIGQRAPRFHQVSSVVVGPTFMRIQARYECGLLACHPPQDLHESDHAAFGAVVGVTFDFHIGAFLLGFDGSFRLAFPIEHSPVTSDALWIGSFRFGGSIRLGGGDAATTKPTAAASH